MSTIFRTITVAAVLITAFGTAAAGDKVTREFQLTGFDKISVSGVFEVSAKAGGAYSVVLTGPAKEMDVVSASVRGHELMLSNKKNKQRGRRDSIYAEVRAPRLTGVSVSGVAEAEIEDVEADVFTARLSGVGEVTISGECGKLDAKVSGVGELDAEELKCREVEVTVSGVGSADVYAAEAVDARVSGMGDITVSGSPEQVRKSGGFLADISIKD